MIEIIVVFNSTAAGELQWAEAVRSTLHLGDSINVGDYTIKAAQFHKPMIGVRDIEGNIRPRDDFEPGVLLELYINGTQVDQFTLTPMDNSFITDDEEVKVTLYNITQKNNKAWVYEYYDPWANVGLHLRGVPDLDITVDTDEDTYTSNRDRIIKLNVTVENKGEGDVDNVNVTIFTESLPISDGDTEDLNPHFSEIKINEEETINLELSIPPTILETQKFILSASVSGYDSKDLMYEDFDYKVIAVVPPDDFILSKFIKDRIYLSETATVFLKVTNMGVFDVTNISIRDTLSPNFMLVSDSSLEWEVPALSPGEEKVVGSYELKPLEADREGFLLPSSVAYYNIEDKTFFVESESPLVIVNGPRIVLEKSVQGDISEGNDIQVFIFVHNAGNAPTKVSVTDQLPRDSVLVSGNTSLPQTFLDSNDTLTMTYVMRIHRSGNYTLPPAYADYLDISNIRDNIEKKTYSNPVNLTLEKKSSVTATQTAFPVFVERTPVGIIPEKGNDKSIPGFDSMILVLCLILTYTLLINNKRRVK